MAKKPQPLAKIKYEGKQVEDGFLDARTAANALIGIDESLRYFIYQEGVDMQKLPFEIPVKIQKGSWEALFPDNIDEVLIKGLLTWGAAKYGGTALSEMAKNDFKNIGFKDVFKSAFKKMTWVMRIAIHLGTISIKKLSSIKFTDNNTKAHITNAKNETLEVPVEFLEAFTECPEYLFDKLSKVVDVERKLVVLYTDDKEKLEVKVDHTQRRIFVKQDESDEVLFPALNHGDYVELEGHITRGNEQENTIGFQFDGHILTCYPETGKITDYKDALFLNCTVKGYIDRLDKNGELNHKRPRIRFTQIRVSGGLRRSGNLFDTGS